MKNKSQRRYCHPNAQGYFGDYGGQFVPETLSKALDELCSGYARLKKSKEFHRELNNYLKKYVGRPTPLYFARNLSKRLNRNLKIFLKREDLCHTGAHKINNTIGQGLLAQYLGKRRIVAETGAGQHGVASATAARLLSLECDVYMGSEDIKRQALNVYKMQLLRARVLPVHSGSMTLKDATNEAIRDWVTHVDGTYYLLGSVVGPHPYPTIVRDFQSVIGRETLKQLKEETGGRVDFLLACVGGGSNAMGLFHPFLNHKVQMIGVEASGEGLSSKRHAASISKGSPGVLHGMKSIVLQDQNGQIKLAHSISAGLDYPSVGPEHAFLKQIKRVSYKTASDQDALFGFHMLVEEEGIMPALESSHAIGYLTKHAQEFPRGSVIVVNLSGRGDKDIDIIRKFKQVPISAEVNEK